MVLVGTQAPTNFPPKSYLNPLPGFMKWPDTMTYILPSGSPWKIYEIRQKLETLNGKTTRAWAFVIGNTNRAICLVEFGFDNILSNISPTNYFVSNPPPQSYTEMAGLGRIGSATNFAPQKAEVDSHESPPPLNIEMVSQALQSYQTGKTTIRDFVRDAKLINLFYPELNTTNINSNAAPIDLERMVRSNYQVPSGSPWKIYETGKSSNKASGSFSFTSRWKFVVGDTDKPICILSFDEEGILREKAQLP